MMIKSHVIKLSKLPLLFVGILLFLCSCEREVDEGSGIVSDDPAMITLSVSAAHDDPATRAGEASAEDIESVYVLQFYAGNYYPGKNGLLREVAKGMKSPSDKGKFSVTLQKSAVDTRDMYELVVFANLTDSEGELLKRQIGKTRGDVQAAMVSAELTERLSFSDRGMPMFGMANNGSPLRVDESVSIKTIQLLRAVARVDVGVGRFTPGADGGTGGTWNNVLEDGTVVKFRMTDVQVWKARNKYAYLPLPGTYMYNSDGYPVMALPTPVGEVLDGTDTKCWKYTGDDIKGADTGAANYCESVIFLPEVKMIILAGLPDRNDVYGSNFTNRLAIIVGGKFDGSDAKTWYRIDFTDAPTNSDVAKINRDIMRNSLYRFSIKRVGSAGFESPEKAYNSKPVGINFSFGLTAWTDGVTDGKVDGIIGNNISFGGLNGPTTTGNIKQNIDGKITDVNVSLKKISQRWSGGRYDYSSWAMSYNGFKNESTNYYGVFVHQLPAYNGELYTTVSGALKVEGVYGRLMVASEDLSTDTGTEQVVWKESSSGSSARRIFPARDLCSGYEAYGYSDWRLPRLSELVFVYLNQEEFRKTGGNFKNLNGEYWSNSEYVAPGEIIIDTPSTKVWTLKVDNSGAGTAIAQDKSVTKKVRCVREVR